MEALLNWLGIKFGLSNPLRKQILIQIESNKQFLLFSFLFIYYLFINFNLNFCIFKFNNLFIFLLF